MIICFINRLIPCTWAGEISLELFTIVLVGQELDMGLELLSSDSALGLIIVAPSFGSWLSSGAHVLL